MRWFIFAIILGIILFIGGSFLVKPTTIETTSPKEPLTSSPGEKQIKVILVGDIMLDRGVEYMVETEGGGDFKFPFLEIADELKKADIVFGNLEGPISDKGTKVGSIYSFQAKPEAIEGLTFAGFDVISLANNHAFDYGRVALEDTLSRLSETGIDFLGAGLNEAQAFSPVIKEINNTKIGFLAYTNLGSPNWAASASSSGIAWLDEEKLKEGIKLTKEKADIVIVSFHLGEEYQTEPNSDQKYFSRLAIDSGADLVVGHHSHIVQKNEIYKGKYIFYSLGNFVFDQNFSDQTLEGQIIELLIGSGEIKEVRPIEIKINNYFQPEIVGTSTKNEISQVSFSSNTLEQGDTFLIKIPFTININEVLGWFGTTEINFFKLGKNLAGIVGIDAKKSLGKYKLTINFPDNYRIEKEINVVKRDFPVTELLVTKELEEKGFTPAKIIENITTKENLMLKEVLSIFTPKIYFEKSFIYPLKKIEIVGAFGNIRKSGEVAAQHLGVDLDADIGTPVYAVNDGVVRFAQELTTYGKTLIIDHGLGIFSLYLHLNEFKVLEGKKVKRGDIIGLSGNTGYSIAPHLHFAIKANGSSVDPLRFIETIEEEIR